MDLMTAHDWSFPVPIHYGPGRLRELGRSCKSAGMTRPLLVTDRGSADLGFIADALDILKASGLRTDVFSEISPNPRDTEVLAGAKAFRSGDHDGVIGIGGGSAMDGAKAIALTARSGTGLWDFEFERPSADHLTRDAFPALVCVPTTAGTGAETESTAMITDTGKGMKFCLWHPALKPSFALLDPELTVGLPKDLTAWTGVDALTHAIEAYCVDDFHPLCDGAALEGMRLVYRWLPAAVDDPTALDARGGMLAGSCLAGVAFLKGLGIVHAVSHMIGAEFETHHGLTNAIILPAALRHNATAIAPKVRRMADAMELDTTDFDGFYTAICALLDRLEIPTSLAELGVPEDCAPRIAEKALQDSAAGTNPRKTTRSEMEAFVAEVIHAAR